MCRLLGIVSAQTRTLTQSLSAELGPFAELSSVHCDGWGIAACHAEELLITKKTESALAEDGLLSACGQIATDAALLHLRQASPGIPVSLENTHPFTTGTVAFAHNGYFPPTAAVDDLLRERDAKPPIGETDSERYFNLVVALMDTRGPAVALLSAADMIAERVNALSLNALMLTNEALYAFAYYPDPDAQDSDSEIDEAAQYGIEPASFELRIRATEDSVVIASSGWEQPAPSWRSLPRGSVLEIRRHDLVTTVHSPSTSIAR
jgi:predicted glutamine amidotransferase